MRFDHNRRPPRAHTDRALFIILFCFIQFSFSFLLSSLAYLFYFSLSPLSHNILSKRKATWSSAEAHYNASHKRAKLKNTKEVHIIMLIGTTSSPLALLTFSRFVWALKKWWDEISVVERDETWVVLKLKNNKKWFQYFKTHIKSFKGVK